VTGGVRGQGSAFDHVDSWASVDAEVWIAPRAAIVASAGRTLADVVRGVPSARYLTLAMRISNRPHVTVASHVHEVAGPRLTIASAGASTPSIEIRVATAQRVELMADFTDWSPVELQHEGDVWRIERAIPSGLHRVAIRIDGGEWTAPVNLPRMSDDLGGVVGLVSVP
jgi:hypothetical protein